MSDQNITQKGMIHQLMADMPSPLRFILMLLLLLPLALAISGILLNVNVGKLIEEAIDNQTQQQRQMDQEMDANLREAMYGAMDRRFDKLRIELLDTLVLYEGRFSDLEREVELLKLWACGPVSNDGNQRNDPEFC